MSQRDSLVCVHSYLMRNTEKLLKEEERTTWISLEGTTPDKTGTAPGSHAVKVCSKLMSWTYLLVSIVPQFIQFCV